MAHWLFPAAIVSALVARVEAKLPLSNTISSSHLAKSTQISFDPLGVLAILSNPRASASAARLYIQPDRDEFRWPHMLQVGAALTPISMLVKHLTENWKSVHPAEEMCQLNMDGLDIKQNIGSEFPKLSVLLSNSWITDALNFQASKNPAQDIVVVNLRDFYGAGIYIDPDREPKKRKPASGHGDSANGKSNVKTNAIPDPQASQRQKSLSSKTAKFSKGIIHLIELIMGLITVAGAICSALDGDIWAVVLFFTYLLHWIASTLISYNRLVSHDPNLDIKQDGKIVFAFYRRPAGGIVVFKGRKDVLERWARTQWVFKDKKSLWRKTMHWFWMTSGTAAAVASVACMVNMGGALQLAFLGMLIYASLAEIILTVLARNLQLRQIRHADIGEVFRVLDNDKWYKSIIQSTLGINKDQPQVINTECRLEDFGWMDFGLLPQFKVFQAMLIALKLLNHQPAADPTKAREIFYDEFDKMQNPTGIDLGLKTLIGDEIARVWTERLTPPTVP